MVRLLSCCALALGLLMSSAANAAQVTPLNVEVNANNSGTANQFTLTNDSPEPIPVEIEFTRIAIDADGKVTEVAGGENDLLVLPQQALVPAGQTQTFRVQYVGDPGIAQSLSYFVSVVQVPVRLPEGTSGIQMLYNFRVLANVAPLAGSASISIQGTDLTSKDGKTHPVMLVHNAGNKHAMLSTLTETRVIQTDASGREIFNETFGAARSVDLFGLGLVPPNSTRRFVLPIDLPASSGKVTIGFGNGG